MRKKLINQATSKRFSSSTSDLPPAGVMFFMLILGSFGSAIAVTVLTQPLDAINGHPWHTSGS
jgi:hypothetical protein